MVVMTIMMMMSWYGDGVNANDDGAGDEDADGDDNGTLMMAKKASYKDRYITMVMMMRIIIMIEMVVVMNVGLLHVMIMMVQVMMTMIVFGNVLMKWEVN
ncbi:hypothetical protein PoB_006168700 [Plakobranchus ocellatus]|uniref:Uncharacterized protein n=1 Tax=Plakobranchus ocellatus TaxID=259542 RepID=A0AAV4CTG3_9GAST|nr:hypothetical protein PoB_006168700 [Plakobranchus ocellatus]